MTGPSVYVYIYNAESQFKHYASKGEILKPESNQPPASTWSMPHNLTAVGTNVKRDKTANKLVLVIRLTSSVTLHQQ